MERGRSAFERRLQQTLWGLILACLIGCSQDVQGQAGTIQTTAELIFYNWLGDLPQSVLDAFTAEYGIKVNYLAYESMEEAVANIRAGQVYDVVNLDNRFISPLIEDGLLAEIDPRHVPNLRNLAASFRELVYDPGNHYTVPYNWGTTGLVVRSDLTIEPVTRWADLWDPRYAGRVALWRGERREVVGLALKSLGYSANSEDPADLEAALARLIELKPRVRFLEDYGVSSSADYLASGEIVMAMGYAYDAIAGRELTPAIIYILPQEGAMLWGENFVIPANSPRRRIAELFLNFLLRPTISAQIANENYYATPNEAAYPLINPTLLHDRVVFPTNEDMANAEIILPLSAAGERAHTAIWQRFLDAPTLAIDTADLEKTDE